MSSRFHLAIQETDGERSRARVTVGTYEFGRDPGCQVVLRSMDVSRRHARMSFEETSFIVEDLDSASGTTVSDLPVGKGKRFTYPQHVQIGGVTVVITVAEPVAAATKEPDPEAEGDVRITDVLDASERGQFPLEGVTGPAADRLTMLCDLPLQFASETDSQRLHRLILTRAMELIPGAIRGALLITDPADGKLALRASQPEAHPPLNRTLIQRAEEEQQGFIWDDRDTQADTVRNIPKPHTRTGMCAPLLSQGHTVGILCLETSRLRSAFSHQDLQFMISVAQYAASAVANRLLLSQLETENHTLRDHLAGLPPKIAGDADADHS